MKILIAGAGKGSFSIRAVQLGAVMGARVVGEPSDEDIRWADVVVLVKRAGEKYARRVHAIGRPLVWDALDCWQQPAMHRLDEKHATDWLKNLVAFIQPTVTIGATEAMARAANGVYLPHHGWAGLLPTPARKTVRTVAYEGNPMYLGKWAGAISAACQQRGWHFVLNPPDLTHADILVAFRDGQWDGWICRQWKSGVKVVNAICAGRPILTQACAAVEELQPAGTTLEDMAQIGTALDRWAGHDDRQKAVEASLRRHQEFQATAVADHYQHMLSAACRQMTGKPACAP